MPLQNRVTPFGEIVAVPGRGLLMGNRGVLHDDERAIVRPWRVRRWIACLLEFRGRRREVMTPHRYTELFFLDEAAALSAGHRPCAECRRPDYRRFQALWETCHGERADANAIDLRLHGERLEKKKKRTYRDEIATLPDGAYVALEGHAWLVWQSTLRAWSPDGYARSRPRPPHGEIDVLTPRSTVAILCAGYPAAIHPSAEE